MYPQLANFPPLEAAALTGSSDSHVMAVAEPPCRLHPQVAGAMQEMRAAAAAAGIDLIPVSSFRSFGQQLKIWNEKYLGQRPLLSRSGAVLDALALDEDARIEAILQWSALPGASRHHWGSDFDVIDRNRLPDGTAVELSPEEYTSGGRYELLDRWLTQYGADFGFFRPYDLDRGGVQPEPWHLSFAPVASGAQRAMTAEVLTSALHAADIAGSAIVQKRLEEIFQRFVLAVAIAPRQALAAPALSPATRPF
jgi:LAS superfamily LD-carboxypeptidase LdcB